MGIPTPGMLRRQGWEQPWDKLVPKELSVLGKTYLEVVRMVLQNSGPIHDPSADWEGLYRRSSTENLRGLLRILAPALGDIPGAPSEDSKPHFYDWIKRVARHLTEIETKVLSRTPKMEAQLTQYTREHLSDIRREIRVCLDVTAAIIFFQTHPIVLIENAKSGDLNALGKILRINPSLERQPWVRGVLGRVVANSGLGSVEIFQQSITEGVQARKKKLWQIGGVFTLLWQVLARLTTDQRRGFLHDLGLTTVPKKKALREFERRLLLKSTMEKPLSTQEQEVMESMREAVKQKVV